jgi:hypothetical protein
MYMCTFNIRFHPPWLTNLHCEFAYWATPEALAFLSIGQHKLNRFIRFLYFPLFIFVIF